MVWSPCLKLPGLEQGIGFTKVIKAAGVPPEACGSLVSRMLRGADASSLLVRSLPGCLGSCSSYLTCPARPHSPPVHTCSFPVPSEEPCVWTCMDSRDLWGPSTQVSELASTPSDN